MHRNKTKNHQINWEKILNKSFYRTAYRGEKLKDLEHINGKPINENWKQFNAEMRKLPNY